jgi:hypothetical protein
MEPRDFRLFVKESNRIEGITRPSTKRELQAHVDLMDAAPRLFISDIEAFVGVVAPGKPLRQQAGMNVRVGSHIAPPGGQEIWEALLAILGRANDGEDPHSVHLAYETLHPFMDGNGRSGRAIWLWQMLRQREAFHALRMGFLHLFYYQTLSATNERSPSGAVRQGLGVSQDDQDPLTAARKEGM